MRPTTATLAASAYAVAMMIIVIQTVLVTLEISRITCVP